jgi:hypothetical protein
VRRRRVSSACSLQRLTRHGLIRADSKRYGSRVIKTYTLAEKGRDHLKTYEAIVTVYAHVHIAHDECGGTCAIHPADQTNRAA